jgi:hypothetical protein
LDGKRLASIFLLQRRQEPMRSGLPEAFAAGMESF